MYTLGRLCMKTTGRDAGKLCIIIDTINMNTVLVDGQTRRRKCNIKHLEPLPKTLTIQKNASTEEVHEAFKTVAITLKKTTPKMKMTRPARKKSENKKTTPKK